MSGVSSAGDKHSAMLVEARDLSRAFCVNRLVLLAAKPKRKNSPNGVITVLTPNILKKALFFCGQIKIYIK
jgi:hypothetical protein